MPAVSKGDGMRGLAVFISDIRNCKSKEAEIKRINKELANIRSKFKVPAVPGTVGTTNGSPQDDQPKNVSEHVDAFTLPNHK